MSRTRIIDLLCLLLIAVPGVLALWLWPVLPDRMPSHWNAAGEVDGHLPKFWGVALIPLVAIATVAIMKIVPRISPRDFRSDDFMHVIAVFQLAIVAFLSFVAVLVLIEGSGGSTHMAQLLPVGLGLLTFVIGFFLGKVRKNFFFGIRTPWTLASDEVWTRTHRVGARSFMLAGVVVLVGGIFAAPPQWLIGAVVLSALYPALYSYLLYRRVEGLPRPGSGKG